MELPETKTRTCSRQERERERPWKVDPIRSDLMMWSQPSIPPLQPSKAGSRLLFLSVDWQRHSDIDKLTSLEDRIITTSYTHVTQLAYSCPMRHQTASQLREKDNNNFVLSNNLYHVILLAVLYTCTCMSLYNCTTMYYLQTVSLSMVSW